MSVDYSKPEIDALAALGKALDGKVSDPKFFLDRERREAELRRAVRSIYPDHGHNLPGWVKQYVAKWRRETPSREPAAVSGGVPILEHAAPDVPGRESGGD